MRVVASMLLLSISAMAPVMALWWRCRRWGLPVRICVDPSTVTPAVMAGYLAEVARRLDERPERMRLAFDATRPVGRKIVLDFTPHDEMTVSVEGHRRKKFGLRRRWIPEHPVPLDLWPSRDRRRGVSLFIEPVDGNRFRVMAFVPCPSPVPVLAASSFLATLAAIFLSMECAAMAAGLLAGQAACAAYRAWQERSC